MMPARTLESALILSTTARRTALLGAAAVLALTAAAPAWAAETAPADNEVAEITITAQKREEKLQDVPLSVAVVQGETLDSLKMNEATDISKVAPSVTFINSAGPRNFGFFVRGIGTSTFAAETIEGSTGYVLDGVVLGQSGSALADLPDIQRLEVLRGPQGTLFGKNASAGVINIVTKRPAKEMEVHLSGSWAWPDNERKISGYVSGPITDTLRFSISGRRNKRDGIIDNVFDGRKFNDRNDGGVRGKLEWAPNEALTATATADYYKRSADCCLWTFASIGGAPGAPETLALAAGIVPGPDNFKQNLNGDVFSDSKSYGTSLQIDYQLGGGYTFTSISAYRRWFTKDGLDSDSAPVNLLDVNFAFLKQNQVSQELRIASPTGGFIDYVAGLYYFETGVHSASTQIFATVPLPFFYRLAVIDAETRNMAAFGQANINISDKFRLIAGARVLKEKVEADKYRDDARLKLHDSATASKSDSALVWRLGAQYDVTDDANLFATVTRGYKGGGYDTNIGVGTLRNVLPEKPTNYEIGVRTSWPALRLIANATVFFEKIEGYQSAGRDPLTATYPISNGQAKTRGVEFELMGRPFQDIDFTARLSGSYVDARWGKFANAPCFGGQTVAEGCIGGVAQDLTGARLPFSPMWQVNFGTHYETAIGETWKLTTDTNTSYRSKLLIAFPNNPRTEQKGYTIVDAAVGVGPTDGRWKASVFAKNLFDKDYRAAMFSTPFGNARSLSQFQVYESQRVVGVAVDLDF